MVKYVDFYGTDLSNNNLEELTKNEKARFIECNLGKTNLQVTKDTNADFIQTGLFDVDLSGISIDLDEMRCMPNRNLWFGDCDLQDTGIRIFSTGISKETDFDTVYQNILNYEGCYVNDKKVMSGSEKYDIKQTTFEEYKEYEANTINKTLTLVRNQITEFNDNKGEEDK